MSFFGNNNNNSTGGFGGFGSSTNNNNPSGGFGATPSSGSMFGNNTATSGGFGGGGGGFGATNTNSGFGANKTSTFGAPATTSAGGMFGANTTTTGGFGSGGGFGSNNNNNNTASGFGGGNTGGGLFGANKPATTGFGATNTGGSMFGGNNTGSGFGNAGNTGGGMFGATNNNNTTGGFGANNNATAGSFGGFGASTNVNANNNNGTAGTPFQAFTEKDTAANQTSHFQSITFQQPYQSKSFEELRAEDYLQGRKYGNSNGQAGSFGTSTGFGGSVFGGNNATGNASTGGLFGNNNAATNNNNSTFGSFGTSNANNANNTTPAFGSNTAGGLFGNQNKPATGSVFGNTAASGTTTNTFGNTGNTGGGLFGGGGGFGANNNAAPATSGGLFGNNAVTQNKSTFGGFGSTNTNTTGGFGNTNVNTGGGLFGNNTNNANTPNTSGGLFGANNQTQQTNAFGTAQNNTSGLFGNQSKPAGGGLFGNSTNNNTGGSLFGASTNNSQQSGGLFGSTNTNTGGGLFGNNQAQNKPAGSGLFGASTTNTNTGGGLFGNNNQQQQGGGGLFGNTTNTGSSLFSNNQNKPATGELFGNNTNTSNTGGLSLFGNSSQQNQQNTGGPLFGNLNNSQNQQPNNNNSLFGNSMQQSSNQQPQQNHLHASLNSAAYGNEQLFATLNSASPPIGPLATPLAGARPPAPKSLSLMASTRINSPTYTPRNGSIGRNGYGFSYSTYGTPNSAYSTNLTPGASSLLKPTGSIGSGLASRLLKSASMNSLRTDGTPNGDSLLRPTPGSISSRYANTGSMRRLNIDRSLRHDLFAPPENKQLEAVKDGERGLKKSVSFDNSAAATDAEASASNALVRTEDDSQDESSPGLVKAAPKSYPDLSGAPEMEQVNGSQRTAPSEGRETSQQTSSSTNRLSTSSLSEAAPGEYWTKPAIKDLKHMSRAQLSKMDGLTVGRENVGRVEFGPCDLTNVALDDICGNIVKLVTRSATVYEEESEKPPMGKGLNVPSTIYLERSWPRNGGGKKVVTEKQGKDYDKHIARLKRIHNTQFKSYDPDTGVWCFTVEHFTTYGLEDDDEDMTVDLPQDSSGLSDPPATPGVQDDDTMQSMDMSVGPIEDDTFEFKFNKRSASSVQGNVQVPGSIEGISYDYDDASADEDIVEQEDFRMSGGLGDTELEDPFTVSGGAVQAPSPGAIERFQYSMVLGDDADEIEIAEQTQTEPEPELPGSFNAEGPKLLRSILKPTPAFQSYMSPEKLATTSWEDQLQQTISPKKRDRQALRDMQQSAFKADEEDLGESLFKRSMLGQSALGQSYLAHKSAKKVGFGTSTMGAQPNDLGKSQAFRTSMDIMNSLWSQEKPSKKTVPVAKGFENPYPKKPRLSASSDLDDQEAAFHDSFKPSFANNGTIVYAVPGAARQVSGDLTRVLQPLVGEHVEVRFAKWVPSADLSTSTLEAQQDITTIHTDDFPHAITSDNWYFANVAETVSAELVREYAIWQLASVLFDPIDIACGHLVTDMSEEQVQQFESRLRKDGLAEICIKYESNVLEEQIRQARSAEEKALLYLAMNDIQSACDVLVQAKDFRLASMVAQLPGSDESRRVMSTQIEAWRERNDWSEMSEPTRAIYSILAGQVCVVLGKTGPAEDRVAEFNISARFGLSWLRSFGLRVFFGGFPTINAAIEAYVDDLDSGRESVRPSPWWSHAANVADDREDALMSLLRLRTGTDRVDLSALFDPLTVSGNAISSRLAWQLATLFKVKGTILRPDLLDHLTLSYASELESAGKLITSSWVLLHLSDPDVRAQATQALLERNAARIPEPTLAESEAAAEADQDQPAYGIFEHLTKTNRIPASLCWSAKALYARAHLRDPGLQTLYLLHAGRADDAHAVLCEDVGPAAVIEQELEDLRMHLLSQFPRAPRGRRPAGWEEGGAVFEAYAEISRMSPRLREGPDGRRKMASLARGIGKMAGRIGRMGLEGRVAVYEMEKGLKGWLREAGEPVEVDFGLGNGKGMIGAFERFREAMVGA